MIETSITSDSSPDQVEQSSTVVTPILYKATNSPESHELDDILAMFYRGTYSNIIGIIQALNTETQKQEVLLAGVELDSENKPSYYPLAKVLRAEEVSIYRAPDGKGGFCEPVGEVAN